MLVSNNRLFINLVTTYRGDPNGLSVQNKAGDVWPLVGRVALNVV